MRELRFRLGQWVPEEVYVTGLDRRPVAGARVRVDGSEIVVCGAGQVPLAVNAAVAVDGYGRTYVTADADGAGYTGSGRYELLREAGATHLRRAASVADDRQPPPALAEARDAFARAAWQDGWANGMRALSLALVAGEDGAIAAAERELSDAVAAGRAAPGIGVTLFGERRGPYSIGIGPDWPVATEPPDFTRPAGDRELIAALGDTQVLPSFWRWIEPERGRPRWEVMDRLLEEGERLGLGARGFTLFWPGIGGVPPWVRGLPHHELLRAIEGWVTAMVNRYRGSVVAWECATEFHDWTFASPFHWTHAEALEVARLVTELVGALDPGVPRIISHCLIWGDYADRDGQWTPLTFLDEAIAAGIPFEAIGLQYYNPERDLLECAAQLDAFAALGKDIWITEMGTPSDGTPVDRPADGMWVRASVIDPTLGWRGPFTPEHQADWIDGWLTLAAARRTVRSIGWWDCTDSQAFVAHGGLLDQTGAPKPSYHRVAAWRARFGRPRDGVRAGVLAS